MNFLIFIISFIILEPSKLCAKPVTSCYSFPCPLTYPCQSPYPDPEPSCEGIWSPSGPCDPYPKISGYADPCYPNPCCPCPINICLKCDPETPNPPSPPKPTPPPKDKNHYMKLLTSLIDLPGSMANVLSGECCL